jgi:hypothetical protein
VEWKQVQSLRLGHRDHVDQASFGREEGRKKLEKEKGLLCTTKPKRIVSTTCASKLPDLLGKIEREETGLVAARMLNAYILKYLPPRRSPASKEYHTYTSYNLGR